MSFFTSIRNFYTEGSYFTKIIFINVAVFLMLLIVNIIGFLLNNDAISDTILGILAAPASLNVLLHRPWTIFTYMFTHEDIWHILFNMLWFYWFGKIFLEYLDQRKLVSVYVLGGLCGAAMYILSFNIFPAFKTVVDSSIAIGASASVMAIVIAIATYVPNYTVHVILLGRVKIIYLSLGILILTTFMDFSVNSGGKLAHIGGAIFGYLFTVNLKNGKDIGAWINRAIDALVVFFRPGKKMKVSYKRATNDYEYNKNRAEHQASIDKILDKISKGGYDSLTKEEKELLFRESAKKNN